VRRLGEVQEHLAIYVGLAAVLMLVVDRFAVLSVGLSPTLAAPDPIARDFARVRREESHLAVASISVAGTRWPGAQPLGMD
jgi:hypothetical protein